VQEPGHLVTDIWRGFFPARAFAGPLNWPHKRLVICGVSSILARLGFHVWAF
jgi:hypothetical protein